MRIFLAAIAMLIAIGTQGASAQTATLTWSNPATRVDGTALALIDIASVELYDSGSDPTVPVSSLPPSSTSAMTVTMPIAPGNHSFTVVVTDKAGNRSAPSNAAAVTVPAPAQLAAPSAVTNLAVTLSLPAAPASPPAPTPVPAPSAPPAAIAPK